jgi:hypothetical protein
VRGMATPLHEIAFDNVEHAAAFVAAVSRQLVSLGAASVKGGSVTIQTSRGGATLVYVDAAVMFAAERAFGPVPHVKLDVRAPAGPDTVVEVDVTTPLGVDGVMRRLMPGTRFSRKA